MRYYIGSGVAVEHDNCAISVYALYYRVETVKEELNTFDR